MSGRRLMAKRTCAPYCFSNAIIEIIRETIDTKIGTHVFTFD